MSETEAHKLLKQQAKCIFKKQGFEDDVIQEEYRNGQRIPDITVGNILFEGGDIDIEKFIEYKKEGKKLIYQPYLTSLSKNEGKKLKYVCITIDSFFKNLGFEESGMYSYTLGCLRVSTWGEYQKYKYPYIEDISIYLNDKLIISRHVPNFMELTSFLKSLFYELQKAISKTEIEIIKKSISRQCYFMTERLKREAKDFCVTKNTNFEIFTRSINRIGEDK